MLLPSRDLLQLPLIQHLHAATVEAHPALLREIFQQAADHLAGGAHIAGHLVVGHADIAAAGLGQLVGEEDGKAAVGAHKQNLLHRPHGIREALRGHLVGKAADVNILLHQAAERSSADAVGLGVLLGVDVQIKIDRIHDTGGREDADLPREEAVKGHVPAILGEKIGSQLAGAEEQDAHAVFHGAVHPLPFFVLDRPGGAAEKLLLLRGQLLPEREAAGQAVRADRGLFIQFRAALNAEK